MERHQIQRVACGIEFFFQIALVVGKLAVFQKRIVVKTRAAQPQGLQITRSRRCSLLCAAAVRRTGTAAAHNTKAQDTCQKKCENLVVFHLKYLHFLGQHRTKPVRDCHYFCFLFQGVITVKIPPRILSMRIPISPMRIMHTITTSDCIRLLALLMR